MFTGKKWVFFIPVLIGVVAIGLLKQTSTEPQQKAVEESSVLVRVINAPSLTVTPVAVGYGTVQPVSSWEAVAQVEGVIREKNSHLNKGAIIDKGSVLFQIDEIDYKLSIAQINADIVAIQAQLNELDAKEKNTRLSLDIESKSLELSKKELKRLRSLINKGSVSQSDYDTQERVMLAQQQSVQAHHNSLNLLPSQQALLEAQLLQQQSRLQSAQRDLANTRITLPFTGRIAQVNVEQDQYVRVGQTLAIADALDKAEIEVQIPIRYFRNLIRSTQKFDLLNISAEHLNKRLGIKARVVLNEGGVLTTWVARFSRLSDTLDPVTRTIGAIVEVDGPYAHVQPGIRPPLFKGLFVAVKLSGKPFPDSIVVPRSALHNEHLYIVNADNRLQIRKVDIRMYQTEFAVIGAGLKVGEKVVVSDLLPAIEGMLLQPKHDDETLAYMRGRVEGEKGND
jgi:RND family efflux transporter MFP subunit